VAGRYRLQGPIGRGAMGIVWRGRDELLDREVAIKEVRTCSLATAAETENAYLRTLREAKAAARLNHPGVVTVFDVVEENGSPWIVMELVSARSLDRVIAEDGPLRPRQAARVGEALLSALACAHGAGVLHRDVKPGNVLVRPDDTAVLTDFGIATVAGDPALTQVGMVFGTPGFTAPERIHGDPATPASDLWSLGATLYMAVEGRGPFERSGGSAAIIAGVVGEPAPRAPSAGPLGPVIDALLQADPARRPDALTAARMLADASAQAESGSAYLAGFPADQFPADEFPAGQVGRFPDDQFSAAQFPASYGSPAFADVREFPDLTIPADWPAPADEPGPLDRPGVPERPRFLDQPGAALNSAQNQPSPAGLNSAPNQPSRAGLNSAPDQPGPDGPRNFLDAPSLLDQPELLHQSGLLDPPGAMSAAPMHAAPMSDGPMSDGPMSDGPMSDGPMHADGVSAASQAGIPPRRRRGRVRMAVLTAVAVVAAGLAGYAAYPRPANLDIASPQATPGHAPSAAASAGSGRSAAGNQQAGGSGTGSANPAGTAPDASGTGRSAASGTGSSGSPAGSNGATAPPAGYQWYQVTAATAGTVGGFKIAVPDTWQTSRQGLDSYLRPATGGAYIEISLASFTFGRPLREARFRQAQAIRQGLFPGYRLLDMRAGTFLGAPDAVWAFSWQQDAGTRVAVEELLASINVTAGTQPYALTASTPNAESGTVQAIFRQALATFQPLP
jgi:serine/threonine protein kinase